MQDRLELRHASRWALQSAAHAGARHAVRDRQANQLSTWWPRSMRSLAVVDQFSVCDLYHPAHDPGWISWRRGRRPRP